MIEDKKMIESLLDLPAEERLKLARILIDSAAESSEKTVSRANGLLSLAGRYAGGPGNTSEEYEAFLETEADPLSGLSVR
jgi:hypothetical protein